VILTSIGFAYGLLDVLNAKFQTALNITAAKAGGLQGAYFGAYFIGPLTYSGWIVRKFGQDIFHSIYGTLAYTLADTAGHS